MKNYLIILLSLFLLGCNNKSAEKVEKVGSDPVTVRLVVHNQTGADMKAKATYCVDKANCEYVIKAGESLTMESNTHAASGTVFMFWPAAPEKADGSGPCDPATGTAQQTYGYWNGSAHVTCDWNCNVSNPTAQHHFDGQHWEFNLDIKNNGNVLTEEVTVTVGKCDE